jgi:hypothetical protein
LAQTDSLLLSEKSIRSAAENMLKKYGSQAWAMADVKMCSLSAEGFDSLAATWERIRDAIGSAQLETSDIQ